MPEIQKELNFWRSFEERAGTAEFRTALEREFPVAASEWDDPVSRRKFLKVMAASLALAGIGTSAGCYKHPQGTIVPYPQAPEEIIPGRPLFFATAMPMNGFARGVLAESHEGRPTKIEGNPDHPMSLGATDLFTQASVLDLYDPDRAQNVALAGQVSTWGAFYESLETILHRKRGDGRGLRLLTGPVTSPTFSAQLEEFGKQFPNAKWHQHDPLECVNTQAATRIAFGQPLYPIYDFSSAKVILSLGGDFLFEEPAGVRYARQFIDGRRVRKDSKMMSRLYVAEPTLTMTGSMADHRLPLGSAQIHAVARAVAQGLGVTAAGPDLPANLQTWVDAVVEDLRHPSDGGWALVVAGETQPPAVHLLAFAINEALGNVGKTVNYLQPVAREGADSLGQLVEDMNGGEIDAFLILGVNSVYTSPADIDFGSALEKLSNARRNGVYSNFTARLGSHDDETSLRCQWHLPEAHYLESWGDLRACDGTASLLQPLIAPLYGGRTQIELMEAILGRPQRGGLEILQTYWKKKIAKDEFDAWWLNTLQKGVIANSTPAAMAPPSFRHDASAPPVKAAQGIEILFRSDPTVGAGEFANNAWLQEVPKPFTKLTWDNALLINLKMAETLGGANGPITDGQIVRVTYRGRTLEAPVLLLPGQADNVVTLHLGYGRQRIGHIAMDEGIPRGCNAYALRTSDAVWGGGGVRLERTGKWHQLVVTRNHHAMDEGPRIPGIKQELKPESIATPQTGDEDLELRNRKIIRLATLDDFRKDPEVIRKLGGDAEKKPLLSLYPGWDYEHGNQWGMSIDESACIGCNACIVACQAENNIAVVGKEEVAKQREMHWIRIDSYFGGEPENPQVIHQPVNCQHCENAPCELVCPVGATTHSDEGLNEMTYNRCIGTRYCSNNCPYKVRRFNFLLYSDYETSERENGLQPGRDGAQPWRYGKMQLLRAADQPDADSIREGTPRSRATGSRRFRPGRARPASRPGEASRAANCQRDGDSLPAGLPDRGDCLRQYSRSGCAGYETQGPTPRLCSPG